MQRTALLFLALPVCVLFGLGACSSQTVVGSTAANLVARYCATPGEARAALRSAIASATAPNRIRVECAADAL